jgi:hypothetical protein
VRFAASMLLMKSRKSTQLMRDMVENNIHPGGVLFDLQKYYQSSETLFKSSGWFY